MCACVHVWCMCVCMHLWFAGFPSLHICTCLCILFMGVCVCASIYAFMICWVSIFTYMYMCVFVCVCICTRLHVICFGFHLFICVHVCMLNCVCVRIYEYMYISCYMCLFSRGKHVSGNDSELLLDNVNWHPDHNHLESDFSYNDSDSAIRV
jgi:hypothetical protein